MATARCVSADSQSSRGPLIGARICKHAALLSSLSAAALGSARLSRDQTRHRLHTTHTRNAALRARASESAWGASLAQALRSRDRAQFHHHRYRKRRAVRWGSTAKGAAAEVGASPLVAEIAPDAAGGAERTWRRALANEDDPSRCTNTVSARHRAVSPARPTVPLSLVTHTRPKRALVLSSAAAAKRGGGGQPPSERTPSDQAANPQKAQRPW